MSNSPVHIKLENNEAVETKRNVLIAEMNLLKILKIMRKYQILKAKELKLKEKMRLNMNSSIINIGKLQHMLPKGKMPHILKEDEEAKRKIQTYKPKDKKAELEKKRYDDLELELQQIQEKLNSLQ